MLRVLPAVLFLALIALVAVWAPAPVESACCYFSAKDKDVLQPGQKAFITWDPKKKVETFTVQPKFEGNAADFGMVIPTPGKPELHDMPREFFRHLAVFTILEPMDVRKFKPKPRKISRRGGLDKDKGGDDKERGVKILAEGVVGSLDYKVIEATKPDGLYDWLKDNKYHYSGDTATLDFYIRKKWFFTVMKIDSKQMKPRADGTFEGNVTPTRFTFPSANLVYPLKITQISVKKQTEAILYIQAPDKMDLPGDLSYQPTFTPMWAQAMSFAEEDALTPQEADWQKHTRPLTSRLMLKTRQLRQQDVQPAALEWAKRITDDDINVLSGNRWFNRAAPPEEVKALKFLKGHVQKGQFITKIRKVFRKSEMREDLVIVRARLEGKDDDMEYYRILPTSPP
jgi:hypothetical protein